MSLDLDLEYQQTLPVSNTVKVLNGSEYLDITLYPRIKELVKAKTLGKVFDSVSAAHDSLEFLGTSPKISLQKNESIQPQNQLNLLTLVDLQNATKNSWVVDTRASMESASVVGTFTQYNPLHLGDVFDLKAHVNVGSNQLSLGSANWLVPLFKPVKFGIGGFYKTVYLNPIQGASAKHGVSSYLDFALCRNWSARIGALASSRHICSVDDSAGDLVRANVGVNSLKIALFSKFQYLQPTTSFTSQFELASQPGDVSHFKAVFTAKKIVSLGEKLMFDFKSNFALLQPLGDGKLNLNDTLALDEKSLLQVSNATTGSEVAQSVAFNARASLLLDLPQLESNALKGKAVFEVGHLGEFENLSTMKPLKVFATGLTYRTDSANFDLLYSFPMDGGEPKLCTGVELLLG